MLESEVDLEIIGHATNGLETIQLVERLQPDLLFLDIEMPALNGLDALRALPPGSKQPLVIFVTGYDQHALNAFDLHAIAYLLKPADPLALSKAVERARRLHAYTERERESDEPAALDLLARDLNPPLRQLVGRQKGKTLLIPVDQIRYFALDLGIMRAHVEDGNLTVNFNLNELEDRLRDTFFRARREVLVNLAHIREFRPHFKSGILLLMNDRLASEIIVSARQVPILRRRIPGL